MTSKNMPHGFDGKAWLQSLSQRERHDVPDILLWAPDAFCDNEIWLFSVASLVRRVRMPGYEYIIIKSGRATNSYMVVRSLTGSKDVHVLGCFEARDLGIAAYRVVAMLHNDIPYIARHFSDITPTDAIRNLAQKGRAPEAYIKGWDINKREYARWLR